MCKEQLLSVIGGNKKQYVLFSVPFLWAGLRLRFICSRLDSDHIYLQLFVVLLLSGIKSIQVDIWLASSAWIPNAAVVGWLSALSVILLLSTTPRAD